MKTSWSIFIAAVVAAFALLAAVALAQESTEEPTPETTTVPSSFNDNRINGDIFLGGLALYCADQNGSTATNTYQNGGITVWGVGGIEYIFLSADQLRGNAVIPQLATMEVSMTEEPAPTETATLAPGMTEEPMAPVLLAQANTPNGAVWFFRTGDDQFALQGTDNTGKFFTYTWTGCSLGSVSTDTAPFAPAATVTPMVAATEMMTAEVTTSP